MNDQEILQKASSYFKSTYPGLSAEAVVCFLVLADLDQPSVQDVAVSMRMTPQDVLGHITLLSDASGAGLITMQNGGSQLSLTGLGEQAKQAIQASFS